MEDFRSAFSQRCKDVETLHEKQRYVASIYEHSQYDKPGSSSLVSFLPLSYSSLTSLRVMVR